MAWERRIEPLLFLCLSDGFPEEIAFKTRGADDSFKDMGRGSRFKKKKSPDGGTHLAYDKRRPFRGLVELFQTHQKFLNIMSRELQRDWGSKNVFIV